MRFLDYRNASGVVCSEIRNVRCVYELQSTGSSLRLLPAWRIDTDTYTYFVDCSSGEVALESGLTPDAALTGAEGAVNALGELTGRTLREDLTARIFERFCVGK